MIRAAIYGLGWWGQTLVRAVNGKSDAIRFVAGISRSPEKHADFATTMDLALERDYAAVLSDPDIDAVALATPHSQHLGQILEATAAGKHVFVEKPMTLTRDDAETAVDACQQAGVALGLGFGRRFRPAFIEMRRLICEGCIGNVLHVEGNHSGPSGYRIDPKSWRASPQESPAGAMTARGIHTLDAMIGIAGNVASVYAMTERCELDIALDDRTTMLLRFSNGTTGYLASIFATANCFALRVFGSCGWLKMEGEHQLIRCGLEGDVETMKFDPTDIEKEALEAFADSARNGEPFAVTPGQAINGIAVLEAIGQSQQIGAPIAIGSRA